MTDLTPILQALAGLICTIITALIIPYIKSKTDSQRLRRLRIWVQIAVRAAEQIFPAQCSGEQKKSYVQECLKSIGFKLGSQAESALIESAVNTMKYEHFLKEE